MEIVKVDRREEIGRAAAVAPRLGRLREAEAGVPGSRWLAKDYLARGRRSVRRTVAVGGYRSAGDPANVSNTPCIGTSSNLFEFSNGRGPSRLVLFWSNVERRRACEAGGLLSAAGGAPFALVVSGRLRPGFRDPSPVSTRGR